MQNEDSMSLRSGAKYVYSTDTPQVNDPSDRAFKFKDSVTQLHNRLESHILTRRLENKDLINFAVGVKRKCHNKASISPAKLWTTL